MMLMSQRKHLTALLIFAAFELPAFYQKHILLTRHNSNKKAAINYGGFSYSLMCGLARHVPDMTHEGHFNLHAQCGSSAAYHKDRRPQ